MRILVVGAGPVGLTFCAQLSKYGYECILVERNHLRHTLSRASSLQPASLECLKGFGFLPRLIAQGQRVEELLSWDLDRDVKNTCSYDLIRDETFYPFRLHVHQSILRGELISFLQEHPSCTILDEAEVISVVSNSSDQGVAVRVKQRGSSELEYTLHGDYLVVSDGAKSSLRSQLGLCFDGYDLPSPVVRFSVDSIPESLNDELAGVSYLKCAESSVSCLKMLDGWRFIFRPKLSEVSEALLGSEWIRGKLAATFQSMIQPSWWQTVSGVRDSYRVSQRVADTRVCQRAILIGDAAHITNTRGGFNLNFGLMEACSLASSFSKGMYSEDPVCWSHRWSSLTASVLMPRAASLLFGKTPFQSLGASDQKEILMRASLLDCLDVKD